MFRALLSTALSPELALFLAPFSYKARLKFHLSSTFGAFTNVQHYGDHSDLSKVAALGASMEAKCVHGGDLLL